MIRSLSLRLTAAAVVLGVLAILIVGTELYLRAGGFNPMRHFVRLPGWEIIFKASPQLPGITEDAHILINELGLRGRMPDRSSSPKILAIGGSTTEDIVLNDPDTWAGRLEDDLKSCHPGVWVGNMGKSTTNARHHILELEKTLPYLPHPDRVVELIGLNDMLYDSGLHLPAYLPPTWWEQQSFDYVPPKNPVFLARPAIYQAGRRVINGLNHLFDGQAALVREVDLGADEQSYRDRRRRVNPEDWVTKTPDISAALAEYRSILERTVDLVASYGSKISFVTQPYLWKPNMSPEELSRLYAGGIGSPGDWMTNPHNTWFTTEVLATLLLRYNDVTLQVCGERGLTCVDLADELPKSAAVFYDDFHFSKAGAAAVGRIIASGLAERCR